MILFKTLRWKNFLSTGNTFTEISLNTHNHTLIVGENGAGKSTILDALSFALFGKPFRKVNKGQLVNSINNKQLLVECEFVIGSNSYLVRRGIKPSVFEIFQEGILINLDAASNDYQELLDKQILKINHKTFSQIIILGSASFTPFMQLPAAARREVIEDLLDIQIFTTMNTLLKERATKNKSDIIEADYQVSLKENTIEIEQQHLADLKKDNASHVEQKNVQISNYNQKIKDTEQKTTILLQEVSLLQDSISDYAKIKSRQQKVETLFRQIELRADKLMKETEFFSTNSDCPTCRQDIADVHRDTIVTAAKTALEEIAQGKSKLTEEQNKINERLTSIASVMDDIATKQNNINANQVQVQTWEQFIGSIKQEMEQLTTVGEFSVNKDRLKQLKKDLEEFQSQRKTLIDQRALIEIASILLKDGGIKTKIIKQYVPIINKLINKYLAAMDFFVNFELNENFEETIKSRFRDDFSYASFSEGEKARIDLALLFTWRSIARLRNSVNTNLLILDEVFDGSLDSQGNDELLKIIQTLTEGSNVFIISHKTDAYLDKFERVLKFEKVKSFSRLISM